MISELPNTKHGSASAMAHSSFEQITAQFQDAYRNQQQQLIDICAALALTQITQSENESSNDQLQQLIGTLPVGILMLDLQGKVTYLNQSASSMLEGLTLDDDWSQWQINNINWQNSQSGETGLIYGRTLVCSRFPQQAEIGELMLWMDITKSWELQRKLSRHQRLCAMGEMSAQLAHQLRTPLSSALLYASQINSTNIKSDQRGRLSGKLKQRLQHMERQISDILMYARDPGDELQPLDLCELLTSFAHDKHSELYYRAVDFSLTFDAQPPRWVLAKTAPLLDVLNNLLDNALQHHASRISIHMTDGELIRVAFDDNGDGIPPEHMQRIFEPFYTTRNGGTGLGLSIARNMMHGMQGQIDVEPKAKGVRFVLTIPAYQHSNEQQHEINKLGPPNVDQDGPVRVSI